MKKASNKRASSAKKPYWRMLVLFGLIFFADFFTKYWVSHSIPLIKPYLGYPFGGVGVFQSEFFTFSIVHTTNTGTAWGMLSSFQGILLFVRIVITGGIIWYLLFAKTPAHLIFPLTCVVAGALGNIFDFFVYGHVIDMFYFIFYRYSYPIFNVADAAIFCSIVYLLFSSPKIPFRKKNAH